MGRCTSSVLARAVFVFCLSCAWGCSSSRRSGGEDGDVLNFALDAGQEEEAEEAPPEPTCSDRQINGLETDVDCGGSECSACEIGQTCLEGTDCTSGLCDESLGACAAPAGCTDGEQNGDETDLDCGGGSCSACEVGEMCLVGGDCTTSVCDPESGLCLSATCEDGAQNGDETDLDCGGPTCDGCSAGEMCAVDDDCFSLLCNPDDNTCLPHACPDDVQNGFETDVDCGGPDCPGCEPEESCLVDSDCRSRVCNDSSICDPADCPDLTRNGEETDVDCGGPSCPPCEADAGCLQGRACESGICNVASGVCAPADCPDGIQNGRETDLDCGGPGCPPCADGAGCERDPDCESGVCDEDTGTCSPPDCPDVVLNGEETDLDCGGPDCPPCTAGEDCLLGRDCVSEVCTEAGICVSGGCDDHVMNNDETDEDCGGPDCPPCEAGDGCLENSDCESLNCEGDECEPSSCGDEILNGKETDVDCGGPDCPDCEPGEDCERARDCDSNVCTSGSCVAGTCEDGVTNGSESDADCGGDCPDRCLRGDDCDGDSDCLSGFCDDGTCETTISCYELNELAEDPESGVYSLDPDGEEGELDPFLAYCDQETSGGGWTLIMKLISGSTFAWGASYWTTTDVLNASNPAPNSASSGPNVTEAKFPAFNHVRGVALRLEWFVDFDPTSALGSQPLAHHDFLYENLAARCAGDEGCTALENFQGPEDLVIGNEPDMSAPCVCSESNDALCTYCIDACDDVAQALTEAPGYLASHMRQGAGHNFFGVNGSDYDGSAGTSYIRFGFASNDEAGSAWGASNGIGAQFYNGGTASLVWGGAGDCDYFPSGGACGCYGRGGNCDTVCHTENDFRIQASAASTNLWVR